MNKSYFPRGNPSANKTHEPIATTHWTSEEKVIESFQSQQGAISPFLFGKLTDEAGEDKFLAYSDDAHIATIAGSRAGKGVSLIAPNLLSYEGGVVVLDMKGENTAITAKYRRDHLGQKVIVLDPYEITEFTSSGINPLLYLDPSDREFIDDITDLAEALIVRGNSNDPHWDESGRSVIKMILIYIIMDHDMTDRNLVWLRKLILVGQSKSETPSYKQPEFDYDDDLTEAENEELSQDIEWEILNDQKPTFIQFLKNLAEHDHDYVAGTAQRLLQAGDRERGSILSTVQRNTEFLDSPCIQDTLEKDTLDLSQLRKSSIYLVLPERHLAGQSRWLRLLLTLTLRQLQIDGQHSSSDHATMLVLDECATLGYMEVIERAAGYIAGFNVKLWTIWQGLSQLKTIYKDNWETFLGNASVFTAFGNIDLTTQDYISKRLGQCETARLEQSISGGTSNSENLVGLSQADTNVLSLADSGGSSGENTSVNLKPSTVLAPLILPEEVGRYFGKDTGKILVLFGQGQPVYANRIVYYEDEPFQSRGNSNPIYKSLTN